MGIVAAYDPSLRPILCAALAVVTVGQTMQVFFCVLLRRGWLVDAPGTYWSRLSLDCAILAFLLVETRAIDAACVLWARVGPLVFPTSVLLLAPVIPLVVGLATWPSGTCDARDAVETLAFLAPLVALATGSGVAYLVCLAAVVVILSFRATRMLMANERLRARTITYFSVIDAIDSLPSGLLCLGDGGRPIVLNQSMRDCLTLMGLPSDAADLTDAWSWLEEWVRVDERSLSHSDRCLVVATPDGRWWLFERGGMEWGGRLHEVLIASDVTEAERLNRLVERSGDLVEAAGEEIRASIEQVQDVAREQALLSMRSKVHDVLGQRLSIIHRYLEDGDFSDEAVASVRDLLHNLLPDLMDVGEADPAAELAAIVSNFALIDVDIAVEGDLPADPDVASAFVAVIREAATNAVRHAQARRVDVRMAGDKDADTLTVTNMNPNPEGHSEGNGLPNMRRALEWVGGTMEVVDATLFTVRGTVSHAKEEP